MTEGTLPIVCTLTREEWADRRSELLPGLLSRADSQETIPGGFRWRFHESGGLLKEVASVIEAERACCRFLKFCLTLEPDGGPLLMEVSGPEGTQEFLLSAVSGILPPPKTQGEDRQAD